MNIKIIVAIKAIIFLSLLCAFYLTRNYVNDLNADYEKRQQSITRKIRDTENSKKDLASKSDDIEASLDIWNSLKDKEDSFQGINFARIRLILDTLKDRYGLVDVETQISKPEQLEGTYKSKAFIVEASYLKLEISAYKEADIMLFLNDLINNFSDYVALEKFSMRKNTEVNENFFRTLQSGLGTNVVLKADIAINWRELKNKNQE